jgi:sugar phosphate isomerase/epimerase
MIYCSTACIKDNNLLSNIRKLVDMGITNIELTGGCEYLRSINSELLSLKNLYNLNFIVHNYFPPPKEDFIINTSDEDIIPYLKKYLKNSIELSRLLESPYYSFHAGFLVKIESFKNINNASNLIFLDKKKAINIMKDLYGYLNEIAKNDIQIYIENNVISSKNYSNFGFRNPFLLTSSSDFVEIMNTFDFHLLLDLAHLKVSCNTLGLDFEKEATYLSKYTNYIHLSGNDSLEDSNLSIVSDYKINEVLDKINLKNKTFTLEVYASEKCVKDSYVHLKNKIR